MAINSQNIIHAVQIAIDAGNSVKEISEGWLKVQQVIYMKYRLTSVVRKKIALEEPTLRYWISERTPHSPAEEGFICDQHHVGLSFPE